MNNQKLSNLEVISATGSHPWTDPLIHEDLAIYNYAAVGFNMLPISIV